MHICKKFYSYLSIYLSISACSYLSIYLLGGVRSVMVIVTGYGHGDDYEFYSWTRLIAFHIALIPLGKV